MIISMPSGSLFMLMHCSLLCWILEENFLQISKSYVSILFPPFWYPELGALISPDSHFHLPKSRSLLSSSYFFLPVPKPINCLRLERWDIIVLTLFVSYLSKFTVLWCLMSNVLKIIISCIESVPFTPPWLEAEVSHIFLQTTFNA